jgi:phage shock protein A
MKPLGFLPALLGVLVLAAWSQTSTQPPAPSGHDHAQRHAQHLEHVQAMCKMMEEQAAEMKATAQTLATNLGQLKATLPLINDLNERSRWQSNIAMWQAVADHFVHMEQRAERMQGMGMGCGMTTGAGKGDAQAKPATAATPH